MYVRCKVCMWPVCCVGVYIPEISYMLLQVQMIRKYPYVLQSKVRIAVFSHSLGSSGENKTYHNMRSNISFLNMTLYSGFVKISASWSFVSIWKNGNVFCLQHVFESDDIWQRCASFLVWILNSLTLWCNCCYLQILCSEILVWYYEEEKLC